MLPEESKPPPLPNRQRPQTTRPKRNSVPAGASETWRPNEKLPPPDTLLHHRTKLARARLHTSPSKPTHARTHARTAASEKAARPLLAPWNRRVLRASTCSLRSNCHTLDPSSPCLLACLLACTHWAHGRRRVSLSPARARPQLHCLCCCYCCYCCCYLLVCSDRGASCQLLFSSCAEAVPSISGTGAA